MMSNDDATRWVKILSNIFASEYFQPTASLTTEFMSERGGGEKGRMEMGYYNIITTFPQRRKIRKISKVKTECGF